MTTIARVTGVEDEDAVEASSGLAQAVAQCTEERRGRGAEG